MSADLDSQLLAVCKSGPLFQAQQLVADGANLNCRGDMGLTPLMRALEYKQSEIVNWLVSLKTVDVDRANSYKNSALHYAARYSNDGVMVAKLGNRMEDATVNLVNRDGKTAVVQAVEWKNVSVVQGLLSIKSVNWQILDKKERSLLTIAREKGPDEMISLLLLNTDQYEIAVSNNIMKIKDDQNAFFMKLTITDKSDPTNLYNRLPKYLGEQTKIDRGYVKKKDDAKDLEVGITGVGKDNSFPIAEYTLLQKSDSNEDDNLTHSFEIQFKMTGDTDQNAKKTVEFFTKSICKSFEQEDHSIEYNILLRSEQMYFDNNESNFIVLPCLKSSLDFLFNHSKLDNPKIVSMLQKANPTWLSLLFNGYKLEGQVHLFGNSAKKPLHLVEGDNDTNLLEFLVKGGDLMKRQQEEFILMLMKIDAKENIDEDGGSGRVVRRLKDGLQSSAQLTGLIESVKSKYPISRVTMWSNIATSLCLNIAKGIGFIFADFGTDLQFTLNMLGLYEQSLIIEEKVGDGQCQHQEIVQEIENRCKKSEYEGGMKCLEELKDVFIDEDPCFFQEVNRFTNPYDWRTMFTISCVHMLLPILMCLICSITMAFSKKKRDWWKIMGTFAVVAKIRIFILETALFKSMAKKENDTLDKKEEIDAFEESVTLALLIEASSESSFQFFFQTLYRLPKFWLNVYEGDQSDLMTSLLNWRNVSILGSFFTLSYSYYTIRNHSKKGALKGIHFGWILSRTVCDALGRTSIVFVWLTLMDADGNFQPLLVISSYYGIVLILIFYNIVFNTSEITCSSEYFIGILLNSLSSIISYNSYDYSSLLGQKNKKNGHGHANHQQSLIRQCIYTGFVTALYASMTISALYMMNGKTSPIPVIDTIGVNHHVTPWFFYHILIFSWICHVVACILTVCYYNSHPSSVSMDPLKKTEIWILGARRNSSCKGDSEAAEMGVACEGDANDESVV